MSVTPDLGRKGGLPRQDGVVKVTDDECGEEGGRTTDSREGPLLKCVSRLTVRSTMKCQNGSRLHWCRCRRDTRHYPWPAPVTTSQDPPGRLTGGSDGVGAPVGTGPCAEDPSGND